jgi:hypothetical protein
MVLATLDPPSTAIRFEGNRYIDNGHFNITTVRASILGSGHTDSVVPSSGGRPAENRVFMRVNRYEPERVHLIVYNWRKSAVVQLDLSAVLKSGQQYKIVEVHNIWGEPVAAGVYKNAAMVGLTMARQWGNTTGDGEFGCFVLFREVAS